MFGTDEFQLYPDSQVSTEYTYTCFRLSMPQVCDLLSLDIRSKIQTTINHQLKFRLTLVDT